MKKLAILCSSLCLTMVLGACGAKPTDETTKTVPTATTEQQTKSAETTNSSTEASDSSFISIKEVRTNYLRQHPDTTLTKIELDDFLGKYVYEVTGVDNEQEYEVKFDAATGKLKEDKQEALDADERNGRKATEEDLGDLSQVIDIEKASRLAEKAVGSGKATEWKLEKEGALLLWEVTVVVGNQKNEVSLDAIKGDVLHQEVD